MKMKLFNNLRLPVLALSMFAALSTSLSAQTRVKVETDFGDLYIKLYDDLAPITVTNFLNYVESGAYDGTFFHRSIPGFVLQGGGYVGDDVATDYDAVVQNSPIVNEFNVSNTRGTLAMAKLGGDPDSATSQWFVNLADNSSNLNNQNGGFTVFGEIEDMTVVDEIVSDARIVDIGGVFTALPIKALDHPDSSGAMQISELRQTDLVSISNMTVETVPEPSSSTLLLFGASGLVFIRRR